MATVLPSSLVPARPIDAVAAAARDRATRVLDARESEVFARGHLPGAGRLARGEFASRRAELPAREVPVLVVHDDPAEAAAAALALAQLGFERVEWLSEPLAQLADGHADRAEAARLWQPSPFLDMVRERLPKGRALDLACGSCREGIDLALNGWRVDAWDHDPDALARANALAARHGVRIATRVVELEWGEWPEPGRGWDVVMVFRFLHRPLFEWLARAVAPGGALVYETFRLGQEAYGHPRQKRFLLEPNELASAFPTWRVEHHEDTDPEGGPRMTRLLARRPLP